MNYVVMWMLKIGSCMRVLKYIIKFIFWILAFAIIIVLFSMKWLINTWSDLTFEELLFHLSVPLEGVNSEMLKEYFLHYGIYSFLTIILLLIIFLILRKNDIDLKLYPLLNFVSQSKRSNTYNSLQVFVSSRIWQHLTRFFHPKLDLNRTSSNGENDDLAISRLGHITLLVYQT